MRRREKSIRRRTDEADARLTPTARTSDAGQQQSLEPGSAARGGAWAGMRVPAALGRGAAGRAAPGAGGTTRSLIVGGMKGRSWDVKKLKRRCTAAPVHSRCQPGRMGTWYMGLTRALSLPRATCDSLPRTLAGGGDFKADRLLFMTDARESRILHCHCHSAPSRQSPLSVSFELALVPWLRHLEICQENVCV